MKRALQALAVLLLFGTSLLAQGGYSYYLSQALWPTNWNGWAYYNYYSIPVVNCAYSNCGAASGYSGTGTALYTATTYGARGEVRVTAGRDPNLATPENYYAFFSASWDPTQPTSTYFALELSCSSGWVAFFKQQYDYPSDSYIVTLLASAPATCSTNPITFRGVLNNTQGNTETAIAYVGNTRVLKYTWTPQSGEPNSPLTGFGVDAPNWYSATRVTNVDLGLPDVTPPNAISVSSIGKSAYINHVDLNWPAGTDDANGTGVYNYEVWRNGSFLSSTTGLTFSDTTVSPVTTYAYTLRAVDYHGNYTDTTFNVTTPYVQTSGPYPSATPEGRRVGVRSTGAYWGAAGENIDVLSGNLNFTLPLVKAQARSGWGVGFNLTYNSQNWRYDTGGNANFGGDVGYGYGWQLLAGSLTPVLSDPYTVSYYLFTDSTGAEYRLDQPSGNLWKSKESIYVTFDATLNRLYFPDGSFWNFGCSSAAGEADQGVMYPTVMQDSNGNQVLISYQMSPFATWANSSARITQIEDTRGNGSSTYTFTYDTATPVRHLTAIASNVGTGENYTFTYLTGQSICSPFDGLGCVSNTAVMRQVTINVTGHNTDHEFTYNSSGELTQILLPFKGYLAYDYTTMIYPNSSKYREVVRRYLSKDGVSSTQYPFSHEASPTANTHQWTQLDDPSNAGSKHWTFGTSGIAVGLVTQYQGLQQPGATPLVENDYTWVQDSALNSYISSTTTTADPGQPYAAAKRTDETVDIYGNVTRVTTYNYGDFVNPLRDDIYNYLSGSCYTSNYIFNRLTSTPTTTIAYDEYSIPSAPGDAHEWVAPPGAPCRGNPTTVTSPGGTQSLYYNFAGGVVTNTVNGLTSSVSTTSATNYSVPSQITVGSLSTSMNYNGFLGLTNEIAPNNATTTIGYDVPARPNSTTSPFGATTSTTYNDTASPPNVQTTINGRWTKTTLDGLGRTIKIETGDGSGTISVAETEYDSYGSSPTGKMKRTALPHAPAASPVWTTYAYDGIGRTLTVSTAGTETAITTTYSYQGNTVTVTVMDETVNRWKKYTLDALGQLTQVNEPNPAGGSDYVTTYGYDSLGHLASVSMPRPSGTQTRTFNYGSPAGGQLLSATNPENGTVSYTYNTDKTVATKTDAKNQQIQYSYDSLKRVTQVRRGTYSGTFTEDTCQREDYSYDTNPYDGTFSQNTAGRLAAVRYMGGYNAGASPTCDTTFTEMYSYSQAGSSVKKRLRVARTAGTFDLDSQYTYDNEGRMTAQQYPSSWNGSAWVAGPNLGNTFDTMGRLQKLTDLAASSDIISNTSYGGAGQLLTMTGANGAPSETRTYNSIGQMTRLQSGSLDIQYNFSTTQNNGKIASETDSVSGEQVVYTYDLLNRLAKAETADDPNVTQWGQSYTYDGFGNLTNVATTKGSTPTLVTTYDPSTNRQTGECADSNGNINSASSCTNGNYFDVENRLLRNGGSSLLWAYSYAPGNRRVWRGVWSRRIQTTDEVTYWGVSGQKLVTYQVSIAGSSLVATATGTNEYFGGKLIKNATGYVTPDRLGSIGKYFPYGQERPSATTDGKEKFATYFRDIETGLDYADQRYHQPGMGRFVTPDPNRGSAKASDPTSWNRYSYTGGDPVNGSDPTGLDTDYSSLPSGMEFSNFCSNINFSWNNVVGYDIACHGAPDTGISNPLGAILSGVSCSTCDIPSDNVVAGSSVITVNPDAFGGNQSSCVTCTANVTSTISFDSESSTNTPNNQNAPQAFCISPSGCGPSSPTGFSNNFAIIGSLGGGTYKGVEGNPAYVPGTATLLVGGGVTTSYPPGGSFNVSVVFTTNGAPITPVLQGGSMSFTGIAPVFTLGPIPLGVGGTVIMGSGGGTAVGVTIGFPTIGYSVGMSWCIVGSSCH